MTIEAGQRPLPHVNELAGLDELPGPTFPPGATMLLGLISRQLPPWVCVDLAADER